MRVMRLAVVAVLVFSVAALGSSAYAFFTAPASGSGQAIIIATIDVNVTTQGLTGTAQKLYPGATKTLSASITNPNPFPVVLDSVTVGTVVSGSENACPGTNVTVTAPASLTTTPILGSDPTSVPITVTLSGSAPSECQGVLFTIPLSVKVKVVA